jgi:hypothetical protein
MILLQYSNFSDILSLWIIDFVSGNMNFWL